MIREIDQLGGRHEILDKIAWVEPAPVDFEDQIRNSLIRLRQLRREQGWELN